MEGKKRGHQYIALKFISAINRRVQDFFRLLGIKKHQGSIQTFTYYIPAPPKRKTGYREKEFDKIFYQFINHGFEIISFHTESHQGPNGAGMWIIFTVRSLRPENDQLNLDFPGVAEDGTSNSLDNLKRFRSELRRSKGPGTENSGNIDLDDQNKTFGDLSDDSIESKDKEELAIPLDIYYE